jgi:class 3 adenylate cyclase
MAAVLFTDLVGSTELLSRLGEAAYDDLRRAHFAALREAIERSGGAEVKTTGDGLLATFPSAADAVACAVGMQQAVDVHSRTAGVPLAIRVGVAVGDVVFEDGDVFGTPLVEAARLVAVARAGQILATSVVRLVAGGRCAAPFADVGSLELKGLPAPVAACEVAWEPLPVSSVPLPSLLTDIGRIFVGRDSELERLGQLWSEASVGERRVVLLAGEPGVGKTRLAAELAAQVHADGATVLAGRCDEDLGVPYQPFVEALRHFVEHTPDEELAGRLGRYGGELVRLLPELAEQVGDLSPPLRSDPETERPGAHYLGMLDTVLGRFEEAEQHFSSAARSHERIGAPAWLARVPLEWALMLVARGRAGDAVRARDLLGQALTTARELGLGNIERRAVALLNEVAHR